MQPRKRRLSFSYPTKKRLRPGGGASCRYLNFSGMLLCSFPQCALCKTEADGDGMIDLVHGWFVEAPHFFLEPALVNRPDLFEQYDRIF